MTAPLSWRNYQEKARDFFSSLGFDSRMDVSVEGVRAVHAIDVYVTFSRFGILHRWLIECKLWRTPVPKEKVLALQAIVQDVGADKGFLLSETGFQAGALRAAATTNIILSDIESLKNEATDELVILTLENRLRSLDAVQAKMRDLMRHDEPQKDTPYTGYISHTPDGFFELFGRASILEMSLRNARRGVFPVLLNVDDQNQPETTTDVNELLTYVDGLLLRIEEYCVLNKDFKARRIKA